MHSNDFTVEQFDLSFFRETVDLCHRVRTKGESRRAWPAVQALLDLSHAKRTLA